MKLVKPDSIASALGAAVALLAIGVLAGWQFQIGFLRAPFPGLPVMTPNTAVGLMLLGLSLVLLASQQDFWVRWVVVTCLTLVLLLGSLTLLEYVTDRSFGIDHLLFNRQTEHLMKRYSGRPSPQTSINLICQAVAMALCLLTRSKRLPAWIVQSLAAASLLFCFVASVGYVFGVTFFYGVATQVGMALHTALSFTLLAAGLLILTSHSGFLSEIFSVGAGGRLARRVLPATLLVPLISAAILCAGERRGIYSSATTIACLIVICTALPAAVAIQQIARFNHQEAEQQRAREQMQINLLQLAQEQAARSAAEEGSERYRLLAEERDRLLLSETAARERAEDATKAKDRFLAVLSHELRTPLTPVLLTISLIERQPISEELRNDVRVVRQHVEIEARLIDDLLDVTRIVNHKLRLRLETTDLHAILTDLCNVPQPTSPQAKLILQLDAQRFDISADTGRLRQAFSNLLNNAKKFTPSSGSITITTQSDDRHIRVRIIDTGTGIEPARLKTIFEPFDQGIQARRFTDQAGLGLGLTIARGMVDAHGGTISATSAGLNQGATFEIELPLERSAEPAQKHPDSGNGTPLLTDPLYILLLEDHPATLEVMKRLLQNLGHRVATASSVAAAKDAATAEQFDLLISDLGLPDGTGHDAIRQIRALPLNHRIVGIALSGYGMEADLLRSHEAGFAEHLVKPIDINVLSYAIKRHAVR